MTSVKDDFPLFLKNSLFKGMNEQQIRKVFDLSKELRLEAGDLLIHEGDAGKEIFFILEGRLEVMKFDEKVEHEHLIATLEENEIVGEISFLDKGYRSAAIRAASPVRLRAINFSELEALASADKSFYQMFFELAKNVGMRLRKSNEKQLEEYKTRIRIGNLLVYIVLTFSLFMFAMPWMKMWVEQGKISTFITIPLTLGVMFSCFIFMKRSSLPLRAFGITLIDWKRSLKEGILITIPLILLVTLFKWFLIKIDFLYVGRPLFEWYYVSYHPIPLANETWLSTLIAYWFVVSPIQELVVRGGLQGSLEGVLIGKRRKQISILTSNLLFGSFHLFISFWFATMVLIAGFYFGWLYSRTYNLLGVWIAHGLLGTWALWILGL